jgi:hypothetical protein
MSKKPALLAALECFSKIADSLSDEEIARGVRDPEFILTWNRWHSCFSDMEPEIAFAMLPG